MGAKVLLEFADPLALSDEGFTPVQLAVQHGSPPMVSLILQAVRDELEAVDSDLSAGRAVPVEPEELAQRLQPCAVIAAQMQQLVVFENLLKLCEQYMALLDVSEMASALYTYLKTSEDVEVLRDDPAAFAKYTAVVRSIAGSTRETLAQMEYVFFAQSNQLLNSQCMYTDWPDEY